MVDLLPRLVVLRQSPWSERARWALDHHRLDYEVVLHTPFLGERRLRRLVGPTKERATVPVLLLPGAVLTDSWDIARHADRHGHSAPLLPDAHLQEIRHYTDLADRTMEAGRSLLMRRMLASGEALDETLPPAVPTALRAWLRPVTRHGARWFARKYELKLEAEAEHTAAMHAALSAARAKLAGSDYLLGSFTFADIAVAMLLQSVVPVVQRHMPLGPATRHVWTDPRLAAEFGDLVAWRDRLYARHRFAASTAGSTSAA